MISTLCTDVRFQLQCTSHWTRKSIFFFPFPLLEIWDLSSPYVLTKSDANCFGDFSHFRVTVEIGKWNFEKLVFFALELLGNRYEDIFLNGNYGLLFLQLLMIFWQKFREIIVFTLEIESNYFKSNFTKYLPIRREFSVLQHWEKYF